VNQREHFERAHKLTIVGLKVRITIHEIHKSHHPPLDSKLPNPGYTIRDRGQIPLPNDSILFHPEVAAANRWNWVEPYNASSAAGVADQSSVAVEADNAADWSVIVVGVVVVVVVAAEPEGASTRERWTKALDFRTRSTDSCPL